MKVSLTFDEVKQIILSIGECMIRNSNSLTELDAALGDGDLGVTVALGAKALKEAVEEVDTEDIGRLLINCGVRFNQTAASTFGVLFATALIEAGKVTRGCSEVNLGDIVRSTEAAEAGIKKRGNAQPGDKTMLDAIVPAVEVLRQANERTESIEKALAAAVIAARNGAEATKAMQSRVGRASYQGTRSVGRKDPGAAAVHLLLEDVLSTVKAL
ncbi:MAG: dihydroxyacetone kinase subunit DhaL [Bacillota bacterium]